MTINSFFESVYKFALKFLAFFPSRLPIGDGQFEKWFASICYTYDLPANDSVRFALSTMAMHVSPPNKPTYFQYVINSGAGPYYVPKRYFGLTALKGAVSQTGHQQMADCKFRQDERKKADEEAKKKATEDAALGLTPEATGPKLAEVPASTGASDAKQPSGPQGSA